LPWARATVSDAGYGAELLLAYGVSPDSIVVEGNSRKTHENAINVAAIWRKRHIRSGLLVTSATHMPRALASFRKAGLDVASWPADFRAFGYPPGSAFDFLPDAAALGMTTVAIKEWLGAIYRLRGWA
jgi:uncharacterized SAM-binding protein YcdF (DUF218 family)